MKTINKILSVLSLAALLTLTFATPALAFDGREGQVVVIESDEVIHDDLYVSAEQFTLEGTVKGDLFVAGQSIIINGTVEGDLFAMGQSIVINGTVTDAVRIGAAAIRISDGATIGGDLLVGGASLETQAGSTVDGDLLFGGGQALLEGNSAGNAMIATGALEIKGSIDGDVTAEVGDANATPAMYMGNTGISIPNVQPGLTISDSAKIGGNFTYTQTKDIEFPSGVVSGEVTRNEPVVNTTVRPEPTAAQKATTWSLDVLRTMVTLILFGLLLGWITPSFMKNLMEKIQTQPASSLGWGVVAYAAFFFALFFILAVMILGAIVFGVMTLGGVSGTIFWLGFLLLFALVIGFVLVTAFLTKIVVAWQGGRWLLGRINPALADHKVWPLVVGVIILALLVKIPLVGWLIGLLVLFIGLGTLWLWGRDLWQARKLAA
ncbi:MAG TPA: polymer-forming cytoskeletal protein [Anaerolineales bacterium]|nr:polymer-forming cytoskeletal protein [Anaerolineales bacterium]